MANAYSEAVVQSVWNKGIAVSNYDSSKYRKDQCGAWMDWNEYGNRESDYGWEIDHIIPDSQNGSDELDNLQPLQWENNMEKGDSQILKCAVRSNGDQNVNI